MAQEEPAETCPEVPLEIKNFPVQCASAGTCSEKLWSLPGDIPELSGHSPVPCAESCPHGRFGGITRNGSRDANPPDTPQKVPCSRLCTAQLSHKRSVSSFIIISFFKSAPKCRIMALDFSLLKCCIFIAEILTAFFVTNH